MSRRSDPDTKPDKLPASFIRQQNNPLDPTTPSWEPARDVHCFDCNARMSGRSGLMVLRKLAGSDVRLRVIVHTACAGDAGCV
jgi:hypothetical protein